MKEFVRTKEFTDENGNKRTVLVWGGLFKRKWRRTIKVSEACANPNNGDIVFEYPKYDLFTTEFGSNRKIHELIIGWSICREPDEFDLEKGIEIAKRRADFANAISTECGVFFKKPMIEAILDSQAEYIGNNIDKFLFKNKIKVKR